MPDDEKESAGKVVRLRAAGLHNSDQLVRKGDESLEELPGLPAVKYSGPSDHWQVDVPAEELVKLIAPFQGAKRAYLVALLNGKSKKMAAASIGLNDRSIRNWAQRDPSFGQAVGIVYDVGFSTVIESELYRRAMAGPDDRGSMRALELIVKSRDADYRDKASLELSMVRAATDRMNELVADYKPAEQESA